VYTILTDALQLERFPLGYMGRMANGRAENQAGLPSVQVVRALEVVGRQNYVENMMPSDDPTSMKWEYTIVHTDRLNTPGGPQLAPIWRRKYADGSTDWDQINKLGEDGWEMVNAFPVESGGTIQYLAFIFKRPKRSASLSPTPQSSAEASVAGEAPGQSDPSAAPDEPSSDTA